MKSRMPADFLIGRKTAGGPCICRADGNSLARMDHPLENRSICHACGLRMDISAMAPFTMVECPECGTRTRVMANFGPYKLLRRHAIGGMSMVFAALDETLGREVALKILSEEYSKDERRIAAFEQEARLTASLSHPHVVRVFTTGRAFGRFYIAMEMVPGGHLEQRIHDLGKIPETEMLPLAIEVAQGLKAAKTAGLIHRDVKPGNILLDAEGHAKLVDFGLALVTQGGKARASELWATPYYVPPESVEGAEEDFRSDIYAFGATLYHTLSGKPPCGEESMATDALREAKKHVPLLEKTDPTLSGATCRLINRAMAYNAVDRHGSYDELIADLKTALANLQPGAQRSGSPHNGRHLTRVRRQRVMISAGALMLAAALWFAWWLPRKSHDEPVDTAPAMGATVVAPAMDAKDDSAEIARGFREARAALEAADFDKAGRGFMELHANPHVHEPTRTWAVVEATLAALLDGESAMARARAATALNHVRTLPKDHPLGGAPWIELFSGIGKLPALPVPPPDSSASGVVRGMLAGLKNWEQGMPGPAADCFKQVVEAELHPDEQWAAFYQKMAEDYLADHRILTGELFSNEPEDAAGCEQAIAGLDEALVLLRTRGRARFNLRAWQLDLKRRSLLLAAKPSAKEPDAAPPREDVLARLAGFAESWDFGQAAAYLKGLPEDPPEATRASLLALTEAAMVFLTELGGDIAREPLTGELPMRDGRVALTLAMTGDGSLSARLEGGETVACEWSDFTADALIAAHRILVKRPASEIERMRRHECAIAFDWLAGNRERALAAALNLSQNSAVFKKRWDSISGGLPDQ
jgi:eukaryotic-like serine/threonine-protein kinase